ncbi:MAG: hypothetical protein HKN06_07425 [Gammaproteobacteria bacterium]|nr:hypothetical protein [Gammaproteobacteria bacterium]
MKNFSTTGKFSMLALALAGSLILAHPTAADAREKAREMHFSEYLARAVASWSERSSGPTVKAVPAREGAFFTHTSTSAKVRTTEDNDDDSSDAGSDDDSSSDAKVKSCLPEVTVSFASDNLTVMVSSSKKLDSVTLLFHDGRTQYVSKVKGKSGEFSGVGELVGQVITGVWVRSGCNYKYADPEMPCPGDDASSDDDSSSDDGSSDEKSTARKTSKALRRAIASGYCDEGDTNCLEEVLRDDNSSDDDSSSEDKSSDDGSSKDHDSKSDDGSSDDQSQDKKQPKCGVFYKNEAAQVVVPVVSVGDAMVDEGSVASNQLQFLVTLSEPVPAGQTVEVEFNTANGTAFSGEDFVAATGVLMFFAGDLAQNIFIETVADDVFESDETFEVVLSKPVGLNIGDGTGVGTLLNDDDIDE